MANARGIKTGLRKRYERSAGLDDQGRLRECVEYLENPQILVAEFADSYLTAEAFDYREEAFHSEGQPPAPLRRWTDKVVQHFIEAPEVTVVDDVPHVFQYMAREIIPLWTTTVSEPLEPGQQPHRGGLDYVGVIRGEDKVPVLGVVKPLEDPTPYLSFLRLLCCLAEVATESQMERANRFLFKGEIDARPSFDLHILLADWEPAGRPDPLIQLTRDLAHNFHVLLREEWQFPNLIRHIFCLTVKSRSFDGMLRTEWRA